MDIFAQIESLAKGKGVLPVDVVRLAEHTFKEQLYYFQKITQQK